MNEKIAIWHNIRNTETRQGQKKQLKESKRIASGDGGLGTVRREKRDGVAFISF